MRAVYDLIVSGAMFGGSMREAFHVSGKISEGLSATLLEKVTQRAEPTESKRQKLDSTSYLEAAMTGIRSRLISTLLFDSAELPTVTINHCVEHLRPHTIASDSKSRSAWAADVNLAAMLRLMELDTASTGIPDLDPGRELLDETRLQLVSETLQHGLTAGDVRPHPHHQGRLCLRARIFGRSSVGVSFERVTVALGIKSSSLECPGIPNFPGAPVQAGC